MDALEDYLAKQHGGRVLDVATGEGWFASFLAENLADYDSITGVDVSERNIEGARERCTAERVTFEAMDGKHLTFPDNSFDTVAISYSLHHLDDVDAVLDEMKRVLKPGGLFVVGEVNSDNQSERQMTHVLIHHWWAEIDRIRGVPHFETYTTEQIRAFVSRLDLKDLFEVLDPGNPDGCEEKTVFWVKEKCREYADHIKDDPKHESLVQRGRELLRRVDEVGLGVGTTVCLVGRK